MPGDTKAPFAESGPSLAHIPRPFRSWKGTYVKWCSDADKAMRRTGRVLFAPPEKATCPTCIALYKAHPRPVPVLGE